MGYVFISYSSKNQVFAESMRDLLKSRGIKTWMAPEDIPGGSKYAHVINRAIKECSCFLLILSKESQNSIWVAKEVERAVNYRKTIIPVQIDDVLLNDEFELYISTDQIVNAQNMDIYSETIKKVCDSIALYCGINSKTDITSDDEENDPDDICALVYKETGKKIKMKTGTYIVGRDGRKAHINLMDNTISLVHALISVTKERVSLKALNSITGTYVNSIKINSDCEIVLHEGDEIYFSTIGFEFHFINR